MKNKRKVLLKPPNQLSLRPFAIDRSINQSYSKMALLTRRSHTIRFFSLALILPSAQALDCQVVAILSN